jgi:hypothetical protein
LGNFGFLDAHLLRFAEPAEEAQSEAAESFSFGKALARPAEDSP